MSLWLGVDAFLPGPAALLFKGLDDLDSLSFSDHRVCLKAHDESCLRSSIVVVEMSFNNNPRALFLCCIIYVCIWWMYQWRASRKSLLLMDFPGPPPESFFLGKDCPVPPSVVTTIPSPCAKQSESQYQDRASILASSKGRSHMHRLENQYTKVRVLEVPVPSLLDSTIYGKAI
jgi:hypothetical protein